MIKIRDFKLKTKFLLTFLLIVIFICIGNLMMFGILKKAYDKEIFNKSTQLLSLYAEKVQSELDEIAYDTESIISDDILQDSLSELNRNANERVHYNARSSIKKRIAEFECYSKDIKSVLLRSVGGEDFGKFDSEYSLPEEWVESLSKTAHSAKGKVVWSCIPELKDSLVLVREIRERRNFSLHSLGTLIVKVNLENIVQRISEFLYETGTPIQLAIYAGEDRIYASTDLVSCLPIEKEEYHIWDTNEGKFFCSYYTFKKTNWTYVTAIPYDSIYYTVGFALKTSMITLVCVMLVALLIGHGLFSSIVRHITNLIRQCDFYAEGQYMPASNDFKKYYLRKDEIGKLYRHFDRMVSKNEEMIQEIYVKQQLLMETQIANLRAQIRPHFIYNTLESIYCLAQSSDDDRIAIMTSSLGKLLRMSLKEKRDAVSLREDVEMAKEYLKIQSVRFGERLRISYEILDQYEEIMIPSMTVQPIVENAIIHAAEEMIETCEIRLYCRENENYIEFIVEDNGPGMECDINKKFALKDRVPQGLGIGLENINRRLKLIISEESGVFVERKSNKTLVIIRLLR